MCLCNIIAYICNYIIYFIRFFFSSRGLRWIFFAACGVVKLPSKYGDTTNKQLFIKRYIIVHFRRNHAAHTSLVSKYR